MKWAKRSTSACDKANVPAGVVPPMHPTLVDKVPEGPNWLHEIKWDGYRIGVYLMGGKVRILTRNLHDWTNRFPSIVEAVSGLDAKDAMIDGEAFVADPRGMPHFNLLQRALGRGGNQNAIMFAAFDLALIDGEDLRVAPLSERREILFDLLHSAPTGGIIFSDEFEGNPEHLLKKACALGLKGVVSKRRDSPYRSGRRKDWVKTKCISSDEFIVIGYEPGGSYDGLGSLLLATAKNGKLIYVGGVGTGFNSRTAPPVQARLDELTTAQPAIPGLRNKQAVWTKPEVVVEIEFRGWTEDGLLRQPSFQRIRDDRSASAFL